MSPATTATTRQGKDRHPENPDCIERTHDRWRPTLRTLCDPRQHSLPQPHRDDATSFGALLEAAITAKLVGLLADRLLNETGTTRMSPPMREFLTSTLRGTQHRTREHRRHASQATSALAEHGIPVAVLNGLAYDAALYGSRGTRQLTDIDLLVPADTVNDAITVLTKLGYTRLERPGASCRLPTADAVAPTITVDLTTTLGHTTDPAAVRQALDQPVIDGHDMSSPLPVLSQHDALLHTLARTAARPRWRGLADALHLALAGAVVSRSGPRSTIPAAADAGWNLLRTHWPDLPATPRAEAADG
ncbi:nucleotidyltransferase family protein [Dactylosporangium darangshiense]|uniref:Nucleotidyltransferase family protein n=1 Tax=Dactylosporangium darangshiense TaxID=579108 RepID=A0ABP8DIF3_9ACTN